MLEGFGLKKIKEEKYNYNYNEPKYDVFKIIYSAFQKNYKPSEEEIKKIPEFLLHNILSNDKNLIELALLYTSYDIPILTQYKIIENLPKMYIKYPKKNKNDENIKIIKKYYKVNTETAKYYLSVLDSQKIDEIKEKIKYIL